MRERPTPQPSAENLPPISPEANSAWVDFNDGQGGMTMGEYLGVQVDQATGEMVVVSKQNRFVS